MGEKLEAAQQAAQASLKTAKTEAAKLIEDAKQEGFAKGKTGAEQFKEKLGKLKALYESELEQDLLRYSLEVAQNLISQELDTIPDSLLRFTGEALKTVEESETVRIRAKPADAKILRDQKSSLINLLQRAKDIDIREDKHVKEGILVQTEGGVIDAQLSTQIEEIARALGL